MSESRTDEDGHPEGPPPMAADGLSDRELERVREAVYESPAAEVATADGDRPQTFPLSPFYDPDRGTVIVTSPPAFSGKVEAVRENPHVSLLFYGVDDPFVLHGRGRIRDDDLEANAEYVQELIQSEPPSPKQAGFSKTSSLLDSRFGRFLFGWYALRIVVEVTPDAIEPVEGESGTLTSWPEQGIDESEADSYERLTFTAVDPDGGYPVTRTVADLEVDGDAALLDVPLTVENGQPACMLCHWHSPSLEQLGQRLLRGRCRQTDDGVTFYPRSTFRMRNETLLDTVKFVVEGKRRTRAYFRERERAD